MISRILRSIIGGGGVKGEARRPVEVYGVVGRSNRGVGVEEQRAYIESWASSRGLVVAGWIDVSGGAESLFEAVKAGKRHVVLYDASILGDFTSSAAAIRRLRDMGVEVYIAAGEPGVKMGC